jgi:hypothetical protein
VPGGGWAASGGGWVRRRRKGVTKLGDAELCEASSGRKKVRGEGGGGGVTGRGRDEE